MTLPPPLVLTNPPSGATFGPGYQVTGGIGSGPLPANQFWEWALISSSGGNETTLTGALKSRTLSFNEVLGETDTSAFVFPGDAFLAHGQPAELRIRLITDAQVVIDQVQIPITLDWQTGQTYLQTQNLKASGGASGGFTEADRLVMGQINQAVLIELAPGIISAIGGVMAGLPPNWWREECLPGVYVNSGTLTKPAGSLSTAAGGLTWHAQRWPPGIGINEGAPDRFEIDTLELRFVLTLANGFHYTYDHRSSREIEGGWLWGIKTPTRVDYWIAPGVEMQFCWLVPTATPYWSPDTDSSIAVPNPFGIQVGNGR